MTKVNSIKEVMLDTGTIFRDCVGYRDWKYIEFAMSAAIRYLLFNPPLRVYRHSDACVFYSWVLPKLKKVLNNVGCFASNYYSNQIYLDYLKSACEKSHVHFFFGPAICINRDELFKVFKNYGRRNGQEEYGIFLHYRQELDKEGWDHRHFSLGYHRSNGEMDTLRIENPHYEEDLDSNKGFFILRRKEEALLVKILKGLSFEYFENLARKFENDIPARTVDEIFNDLKGKFPGNSDDDEMGTKKEINGRWRYKGFIIRGNDETRIAKRKEVLRFIETLKT